VKTLGLCLIFLSSVSIGFLVSHKTKEGAKNLREIIKFINYIKNQIEFFNASLEEIYSSYKTDNDTFNNFVNDISEHGWNIALSTAYNMCLPQRIIQELKNYSSLLGKSNKDEQLIHNNYYINFFENEYRLLEKSTTEKTKVSISLGIYIGMMLVILFI